jgi:hypothetical protein
MWEPPTAVGLGKRRDQGGLEETLYPCRVPPGKITWAVLPRDAMASMLGSCQLYVIQYSRSWRWRNSLPLVALGDDGGDAPANPAGGRRAGTAPC